MNKLNFERNIGLLLQGLQFAQSHVPKEAIPDSYDKYEPTKKNTTIFPC